ncbi:carbohydrate ABC transporter permease [Faecalibacterium gallinarum]|uniref:Sugar transport system permease n=1 Tax=Faecalibacterium gallinarum TaxID=2903556 RepID=A0AA37NB94_9FIRM|nr:sugar ABC transporter permease [Faecalibacterium gallinarum]GJN65968.1 sugar transport system permease [Faecalibacterium gallinarum]
MAQTSVKDKKSAPKVQNRPASRVLARRETISAYLFMLPSLIFFVGFVLVPMGMCLVYSFLDMGIDTSAATFTGLSNYVEMFQDKTFIRSLWNTILIVVVSVPLVTAFSLWVGSAIYPMRSKLRSFFRCVFYLPVVTGSVAVTVVWKWMFNPYNGLLNQIFGTVGFDWLGDTRTAIWCIIMILFTTSIGQPIVLYVAALGNVDRSLEEAAAIDGATRLQIFWKIKWPQIMPTTLYVLVITTINSFQCFALIQLLTRGGPLGSTSTLMYYIFDMAYNYQRFGYANAMGVVLAIFIAIFSAIQFKVAQSDNG